jgi:hypothetical protein
MGSLLAAVLVPLKLLNASIGNENFEDQLSIFLFSEFVVQFSGV